MKTLFLSFVVAIVHVCFTLVTGVFDKGFGDWSSCSPPPPPPLQNPEV